MEYDSKHASFIYIAEPHDIKSSVFISVLGALHSHNNGTERGEGSDKIAWLYNLSAPVKMAMCYFIRSCWDITDMLIIKHVNCKS